MTPVLFACPMSGAHMAHPTTWEGTETGGKWHSKGRKDDGEEKRNKKEAMKDRSNKRESL